MNSDALKAIQAPFKAQYKDDPGAAMITLRATANGAEGIACRVDTGRALVEAGLHPATGGTGPGNYWQSCSTGSESNTSFWISILNG